MTNNQRRSVVAFSAAALLGCGGGEKPKPESTAVVPPAAAPGAAAPSAAAPQAATGKTWDVKMTGDQTGSRYIPAALTIKQGDAVRWTMITEPPHNVAFWSDSIPAGGATALQANMTQTMGALTGPFLMTPNQTYTISFAGVPPGVYKYYCVPHIAAGMKGVITVQ